MDKRLSKSELKIFVNIQAICLLITFVLLTFEKMLSLKLSFYYNGSALALVGVASLAVVLHLFCCRNRRRQWFRQAVIYTLLAVALLAYVLTK